MRPIPLDCTCCKVWVLDRRQRTSCSIYRYNGEECRGVLGLAKALGTSIKHVRNRLYAGRCLKATQAELLAKRQKSRSSGGVAPEVLARQFLVNMAQAEAGRRAVDGGGHGD